MDDWELEAALYGGLYGGEYLESISITDLAELDLYQWGTFLECICKNYHQRYIELQPNAGSGD